MQQMIKKKQGQGGGGARFHVDIRVVLLHIPSFYAILFIVVRKQQRRKRNEDRTSSAGTNALAHERTREGGSPEPSYGMGCTLEPKHF